MVWGVLGVESFNSSDNPGNSCPCFIESGVTQLVSGQPRLCSSLCGFKSTLVATVEGHLSQASENGREKLGGAGRPSHSSEAHPLGASVSWKGIIRLL